MLILKRQPRLTHTDIDNPLWLVFQKYPMIDMQRKQT